MHRANRISFRRVLKSVQGLTLLALAACGGGAPEEVAVPVTAVVYEGATLITGSDAPPIENATFVVDGGRFVAVGATGDVQVPVGATLVDLTGMTVMPAIVDAHTHPAATREALIGDLERRAYFGISGIVSMGMDDTPDPLDLRSEVIPGAARNKSAGVGITSPEPGRREVHWVRTEEEAREAVREEAARNVDLIKIWVDDRNGQYEKLPAALYRAVIDEAHQRGLKVAAHIFSLDDAKELLRAGVDIFAHGVRDRDVDDEFVALVQERPGVVLIPNLPSRGVATDLGWLAGALPAAELETLQAAATDNPEAQATFAIQARNLARLATEGMTIAFGTDGNTPWAPHVEMEDMVAAGMTPAQVIVAATRNAAAAAGWDDLGTVEAGKSADFVVLEANPLDDITNTRRISAVYLRGTQVDRSTYSMRGVAPAN